MSKYQNTVELIGTYGGDITHAQSAWTSTNRELTPEKQNRVGPLLKMLAENGHHTPFEKSSLHFLVTTDIASHIHILKSRIGCSVNSESARYKELKEDRFYIPEDWSDDEQAKLVMHCNECFIKYHNTLDRLVESGLPRKRAKESARYYLPYATQLTADVMFNFRSFMHFLGLRYKPEAQTEIRDLSGNMLRLVKCTGNFDFSLGAFGF